MPNTMPAHKALRGILLLIFSIGILSAVAPALAPAVHHPLDGLTPEEYWSVYGILQSSGKLEEKTIFASVLLHEPPKAEVLSWKEGMPIPRQADVVLYNDGKSWEALVNITAGKIDAWHQLKDAQAPITETEAHSFDDVIYHDPQLLAALSKRGIKDLRQVTCFVSPAGYVGLP